jgi:DNA-binding Lrp family transcriptional regulator
LAAGAYILVSVDAGHAKGVLATIRSMPGVKQAHTCWGQPDIFAYCETSDDAELASLVLDQIQILDGVRSTESHLVVEM